MSSKMPPVPPQNRSPKGPGDDATRPGESRSDATAPNVPGKTGQVGNTKVNTKNQGQQQDR